jgi:hypothetical protein
MMRMYQDMSFKEIAEITGLVSTLPWAYALANEFEKSY